MRSARTYEANVIDFSSTLKGDGKSMCKRRMLSFIKGIRGIRQNPVTMKQIINWFKATPEDFIHSIIDELLIDGSVIIVRKSMRTRGKRAYYYELTEN